MKKMKLAVLGAAIVAMTGFSSCLDSDTNNISTGMEFVKNSSGIGGFYRFENSVGLMLEPNNQSQWAETSISTPYAIIQYQYSPDSIKQNSKRLPITLQGMAPVTESAYLPTSGEGEETWANAPLYQVGLAAFPYFDKDNLFLGVQYYAKTNDDGEVADSEKNGEHQFALYCAKTEEDAIKGSNLILYVLHKVNNTGVNSERKSSKGFDYVHFRLSEAISWYKSQKSGELPEQLVIKYKVPSTASGNDMLEYEKAVDVSTTITLPYREYFKDVD